MSQITQYTNLNPDDLKKVSGIYRITHVKSSRHYIGEAKDLRTRLSVHLSTLIRNCHENGYLQRTFNKHGIESFEFEILELCEEWELRIKENHWVRSLDTIDRKKGFNLRGTDTEEKIKYSEEFRKAISDRLRGIPKSKEHIEKIIKTKTGVKQTEERKRLHKINQRKILGKRIVCLDLLGNYINTYDSIAEAKEELNIKKEIGVYIPKDRPKRFGNYQLIDINIYNLEKDYKYKQNSGLKKMVSVFNKKTGIKENIMGIKNACEGLGLNTKSVGNILSKNLIFENNKYIIVYEDNSKGNQ